MTWQKRLVKPEALAKSTAFFARTMQLGDMRDNPAW
jgi:hypothetical protein